MTLSGSFFQSESGNCVSLKNQPTKKPFKAQTTTGYLEVEVDFHSYKQIIKNLFTLSVSI